MTTLRSRLLQALWTLATLSLLLFTTGCGDDFLDLGEQETLQPSNKCEPACTGEGQCFELENGEPGCLVPNCQNNTVVCRNGFPCNPQTDTCESPVCEGGCELGTHCVYGSCITNYTNDNACAPLFQCRESCPPGEGQQVCSSFCQDDANSSCLSCLDDMATCEQQNSCDADATTCCVSEYCQCFPNNETCLNPDAPPCEACAEQCRGAQNPNRCLSYCAEQNTECSTCFEPFQTCAENNPDNIEVACEEEFCSCIDCSSAANINFSISP